MAEAPVWIEGSQKFWYRKSVKGGNQFVLVDPAGPAKAPAFDHARLATAISTAASGTYTAMTLPFTTFTFVDNMQAIEFAIGGARWRRRTRGRRRAGGARGCRAGRGCQPARRRAITAR